MCQDDDMLGGVIASMGQAKAGPATGHFESQHCEYLQGWLEVFHVPSLYTHKDKERQERGKPGRTPAYACGSLLLEDGLIGRLLDSNNQPQMRPDADEHVLLMLGMAVVYEWLWWDVSGEKDSTIACPRRV